MRGFKCYNCGSKKADILRTMKKGRIRLNAKCQECSQMHKITKIPQKEILKQIGTRAVKNWLKKQDD